MPRYSSHTLWQEYQEYGTGKSYSTFKAKEVRIHAAIKTQMSAGGLKGALLTKAVNAKLENWRTKGEVKHAVYDALVFRKVSSVINSTWVKS